MVINHWRIVYTKQAQKDAKKISKTGLKSKVQNLISLLQKDPFKVPLRFEKLIGDLSGAFSRRINIQHHLVYQVIEEEKTIKIIRMWTHYQ